MRNETCRPDTDSKSVLDGAEIAKNRNGKNLTKRLGKLLIS